MAITNTELAQQISDLINSWQGREDEMQNWLGGVAGGGAASDGKYPLTDAVGVTRQVACPAQIQADAAANVAGANAAKDELIAWMTGSVGGGPNLDGTYPLTDSNSVVIYVKCPAQLQADLDGSVKYIDTTTAAMQFVVDEDDMLSNLSTKVPTQQSVKAYVDGRVTSSVKYQGGYNASTNTPDLDTAPSGISQGFMYTVTVAGTFFTVAVEIGDVLIAEIDNPTVEADWTIVNKNLDASSILAALLGVDGSGSGLDADLLDGLNSSQFVRSDQSNTITGSLTLSASLYGGSGGSDTLQLHSTSGNANRSGITIGNIIGGDNGGISFGVAGVATELIAMRIEGTTGNVGIGVTNPANFNPGGDDLVIGGIGSDKGITIYTDNTSNGVLYFADGVTGAEQYQGYIYYSHPDNSMHIGTAAAERLTINSKGDVGIGVTPKTWNADRTALQLGSKASLMSVTSAASTAFHIYENAYYNGTEKRIASGRASSVHQTAGKLFIRTAPSDVAESAITWITSLTMETDGGVLIGAPTGGSKGLGTINAQAVYDDNVLLTDYVFDYYMDGEVKEEDLPQAKDFLKKPAMVDVEYYSRYWKRYHNLPSLPTRKQFAKDGLSVGKLAQRLWETVELQAIHIDKLNSRMKTLEQKRGKH